MNTMKAIVLEQSDSPEVLQIKNVPLPEPKAGWALIRIHAFGLNRSEMFTRQGHSPDVEFPRILGIEAVGEVADDPGGTYPSGQIVAAVMGGMGRQYVGGYAEYVLLLEDPAEKPGLVIDQFEEVFTLVQNEVGRTRLLASLVAVALYEWR